MGKLIYTLITRIDIVVPVSMLARYQAKPLETHWQAAKRLIRYLKGTVDHGVWIGGKSPLLQEAYCDADWGADEDCKARTGILLQLGDGCPLWYSKRQTLVAQSTAEAEFSALNEATTDIMFTRVVLEELGVVQDGPIKVYEDNQSCIKIVEGKWPKGRTKHLDRRIYNIKDHMEKEKLNIQYCPTQLMKADLLTKNFARPKFRELLELCGVDTAPIRMERVNNILTKNMERPQEWKRWVNAEAKTQDLWNRVQRMQERHQGEFEEAHLSGDSRKLFKMGLNYCLDVCKEKEPLLMLIGAINMDKSPNSVHIDPLYKKFYEDAKETGQIMGAVERLSDEAKQRFGYHGRHWLSNDLDCSSGSDSRSGSRSIPLMETDTCIGSPIIAQKGSAEFHNADRALRVKRQRSLKGDQFPK